MLVAASNSSSRTIITAPAGLWPRKRASFPSSIARRWDAIARGVGAKPAKRACGEPATPQTRRKASSAMTR